MIKLQLGFTDVEETDNLVIDDTVEEENTIRYNIFKQSTNEKAIIEWKLHTEIPAVQHLIETWEYIIRQPHLAMIQKKEVANPMLPTHNDIDYAVEFINLLPLKKDFYEFVDEDFEYLQSPSRNFGDLVLSNPICYEMAGYNYEESAEYAATEETLDFYNPDACPVVLPRFNIDFALNPHQRKQRRYDIRFLKFLKDNASIFEEYNYSVDRFKQTYGRLQVGTLITDPEEAYKIVSNNSYICRTSMTKED